jgi:hypothetical protein
MTYRQSARAVAALVTIPFERRRGAAARSPTAAVRTAGAEPVSLRTPADRVGSGCLQALTDLGQTRLLVPGERHGGPCRRADFRSAGRMRLSRPAPRQRRCSSKPATSSRPIEALASARIQQPTWSAATGTRTVPMPMKAAVKPARDLVGPASTRSGTLARHAWSSSNYDVLARTELASVPRRRLLAWEKGVPRAALAALSRACSCVEAEVSCTLAEARRATESRQRVGDGHGRLV